MKSKVKKKEKVKTSKKSKKKDKKGVQLVYLSLGSNVGDREEYIEQAVFLIRKIKGIEVLRRSSNYETDPEGKEDQQSFLNCVIEIKTILSAHKLLEEFQNIEQTLGREREVEWGPRTIDIDILIYGDSVISDDKLQIPHPLMHERLFVLQPLKELSPQLMHPVLEKSISTLYEERKIEIGTDKYDDELPGFKEIKTSRYDDYEKW
ncbi:2-amino-4-hydroxy-6-hydroxymethyldihydropteridine diphosphokinase [candidate division WOR-1 bacterium RIFOXYA2_FULL_36_21]|uniref:2-amino-4-hydroxy-6-hydroxymethyldihydropteridine diphosphokinase n=1 Tax=candidate division WOR-1 bacterium RIFOXYB2_FULL_36_35 TaxID=1802578 RepID=A0A1F4S496_UNCSA|nr:MAG: 2-amino-4-hydroxy-6-hydroxymethyldihydropteridine diphosphokinase [candidate division WOR-1 bacterium RIFOXYA2_FULL_36_21]OGC14251.1 MAG: 2-amino-4-hydroxy-6-hydroxymethyldihydropteridine diphosphokinase [candidate division WOR-1 bacterium RIFOXYA12_FULL_36_13]OGC15256.1 MAG: 2-amino-4-hydroxy-6-hydroxymethyldihydropteridine diphosphokinase [candidate division WOR-1 bacterium RIFOXYB2_FULL_36_35]